jgi:drug/metabolite transporter (DMT)-like permease
MSRDRLAYLFVATAAILWGTSSAVQKLLLKDMNSLQVLLYSSLFATAGLFVLCVAMRKIHIIKTYRLKDYAIFAGMGFIGVFLYYAFLLEATALMPAQEAFIINYLWPIMVVVFAIIILKEKLTVRKSVAMLLSFIGVTIVVSRGNFSLMQFDNAGAALAVLAAVSYGLFSVLTKKLDYDRFTSTMFYYLFSFIFTLIGVSLFSSIPHVAGVQILGLLWLGIFTSGIAFIAWFFALKFGDVTKVSNMIFITPFISLVFIRLLVGEQILASSILGLTIIVASIVLQATSSKQPKTKSVKA